MQDWEYRYQHDKAVRDSQCVSLGVDIPDDQYGRLTVPDNLFMRYKGREFWAEMNKRGHTAGDFDRCGCKPKKG